MSLRRFSGLARPLDLAYSTNRWIGAASLAILAAGWLLRGAISGDWLASGAWASLAALAVFLSWALCRELDPDRERIAFLASGLALLGIAITGLPDIAGLFAILLTIRVVNRTTGSAATALDGLALFALTFWIALGGVWLYLALACLASIFDGLSAPRSPSRAAIGVGAAVLATGAILVIGPNLIPFEPQMPTTLLAVLLAAALYPAVRDADSVETPADETGERLSSMRLRLGQLLAAAAALGLVLWRGDEGFAELMPLWAAMVAAGAGRLHERWR
jgi:hypothetical protein